MDLMGRGPWRGLESQGRDLGIKGSGRWLVGHGWCLDGQKKGLDNPGRGMEGQRRELGVFRSRIGDWGAGERSAVPEKTCLNGLRWNLEDTNR